MNKAQRIKDLLTKKQKYERKLLEKSRGYGDVVRTRFGDSYEDQLRDDTNALRAMIRTIEDEILSIENEK